MSNPFVNIGDNFTAESYNGAIAFFTSCNPMITITLPDDIGDSGNFILGTTDEDNNPLFTKAGFTLLNLALVNTEIYNNTIRLIGSNTTGTATFRVYPNIEPFKYWSFMSWVGTMTTGTITCRIFKNLGSQSVYANYPSGYNLSTQPIGLECVDFVFTLTKVSGNNPVLNSIQIQLRGGL